MAVKESRFNRKFRSEMERLGLKIYRFESHATCPGAPDNHFIIGGKTGWIEMKETDKDEGKVQYRPAQVPWIVDYVERGGTVWTVVNVKRENFVLLIPGSETEMASRELRKAKARCVSLDWDECWEDIFRILLRNARPTS